ncbi:Protein CBG26222 [Caenorhabditis briggsae]|uniref:Protein CBG26222 n=1 Tax=Caenorhabditis briggsae TaxID=6238 RepID=B6IEN0_CAEBR|nr:Protein CBG26222 [Caenorhabditis briggsae]CAR98360.1 Protein CBG26222 [Caenorhabditis briggsae]
MSAKIFYILHYRTKTLILRQLPVSSQNLAAQYYLIRTVSQAPANLIQRKVQNVGGFYAIQSKQKNQIGNQGTSGGAAQPGSRNNQGASGSKSNEKSKESGSKEAIKEA